MAEGLLRSLCDGEFEVHSAGSDPSILNPFARRVLEERGIATEGHHSKGIADVPFARVDTVITLCEEEVCPKLPDGAEHLHWPMPDPAAAVGTDDEKLAAFREVCGMIEARLRDWQPSGGRQSATA